MDDRPSQQLRRCDESTRLLDSGMSEASDQPAAHEGLTRRSGLAFCFLSLAVAFERFAYYSLSTSLWSFASQFFNDSSNILILKNVFEGTIYFLPIFGASIADAYGGHFEAIIIGGVIYFLGASIQLLAVFTCGCFECTEESKLVLFYAALCLIALGCSLFKPNITIFWAHQSSRFFGHESVKTSFVWFYWMVSFGALFSGIAAIDRVSGQTFIAATVAIAVLFALVFFLFGHRYYHSWLKPESKKLLLGVFKISWRKLMCRDWRGIKSVASRNVPGFHSGLYENARNASKRLWRICLVLGVTIIFWIGYGQILTSFHSQMELAVCHGHKNDTDCLTDVYLNTMNAGNLLIFLPVLHFGVMAPLKRKFGDRITIFTDMGIGFLLMMFGIIAAGFVELFRPTTKLSYSGWIILPQVTLLSMGEALGGVGGYCFSYTQSPDGLEGLVIGLQFGTWAIANYLSSLTVPEFHEKAQKGYYSEVYLFGIALFLFIGYVLLVVLAKRYQWGPVKDPSGGLQTNEQRATSGGLQTNEQRATSERRDETDSQNIQRL